MEDDDNNNNNNDGHERKKGLSPLPPQQYHEFISFATQGMSDYAQFSVAIAVGIFGILAIFASLDTHKDMTTQDWFWEKGLWTQSQWIRIVGVVLSIAYWALVLFGIQSYVSRRLFEGPTGNYLKKSNQEWYFNNIQEIARENKLVNLLFKLWSSNHEREDRYKGIKIVLSLYVGIAFLLWLFIIIL